MRLKRPETAGLVCVGGQDIHRTRIKRGNDLGGAARAVGRCAADAAVGAEGQFPVALKSFANRRDPLVGPNYWVCRVFYIRSVLS